MGASIIVPVRLAVVAGIKAALGSRKDVSVTYGWQGSNESRRRAQIFTNHARATHQSASLRAGRNFRNERMDFDIVVLVAGIGNKPEETDAAAMALGLVVEEFIADHKNRQALNVPGLNWIEMSAMELANAFTADASLSEVTYTATYDARLT